MIDGEILKKAVQKAIDNGWVRKGITDEGKMTFGDSGVLVDWLRGGRTYFGIGDMILDHDFAKALWGEELTDYAIVWSRITGKMPFKGQDEDPLWVSENRKLPNWQRRLQQMVIADDPIKYLKENI